jgi:hypothetical protein
LILKDSNYVLLNLNSFLSFSFQRGIPLTIVKFYQMFWAVYMFFVAFRVFLFSSLGTESRSSQELYHLSYATRPFIVVAVFSLTNYARADLEFMMLPIHLPSSWYYRHAPPCTTRLSMSGRDESTWVVTHLYKEAMLGISLFSYLYLN